MTEPEDPAAKDRRAAQGAEDARLLTAWKLGDLDAADELISRHFAMIYRFFASKVHSEATDLTQQTFAKAVETVDAVHSLSSFRAYLMAIARNLLYSHFRGRAGAPQEFDPIATSLPALATSPTQAAARQERRSLIGHALRRLPLELQILLELHYWEGLTLREVADVVATPEGTVKSRMNRALNLLRGHVDELSLQHRLSTPTDGDLEVWSNRLSQLLAEDETPT